MGTARYEERGSGSVLAVAILAAILMVFSLLLPVIAVVSMQQRAAGAADAAALAAADVAVGIRSGSPCVVAAVVAVANTTRLERCLLDEFTATVRVTGSVLGFEVSARATAGRPPDKPVVPTARTPGAG